MRRLNTGLSLICAAVMLCAPLAAVVLAGCGGPSSATDPLEMLLYGTVVVFAYDMEAVNAGEAGDAIKEIFEDYWDTSLGTMGVLMNEITTLTVGGSSVSPLSGTDVHADHHWRGVAGHPHSGPGVVDGYSTVRGCRDRVGAVHQSHTRAASRPESALLLRHHHVRSNAARRWPSLAARCGPDEAEP